MLERVPHPELGLSVPPTGAGDIAIVGEAPGASEQAWGEPFVGTSGKELRRMLEDAGINMDETYRTNVFKHRPPSNKVDYFFTAKASAGLGAKLPPLAPGRYISELWLPSISSLLVELHRVQPKLVIALGNTALWALVRHAGIAKHRGVTRQLKLTPTGVEPHECLLLPTYHPSAVVRQWDLRSIVVADLMKAKEALQPKFAPDTIVEYEPTRKDLAEWSKEILAAPALGVDIETRQGQITMIGFATTPYRAYVVPFWVDRAHYWPTLEDEVVAVNYVQQWLQSPQPKVGQNFLYDTQYIIRNWGFYPRNVTEDMMLKHHSIQPEMQKSLGFLGSIYLDRPAWKTWAERRGTKKKEEKKDD